ncbi:hypothetical protein [Sphingomonas sp.]|uniref:hypothetical protein n=1 Tax=Sphingomonas sp. TaxID=28214 RepID=UPI003F71E7F6
MAKISELDLVAEPDGDEPVVILKDGEAKAASITPLVAAAVAPSVSAAQSWAQGDEPGGPGSKSAKQWAEQAQDAAIPGPARLMGTRTLTSADAGRSILTEIVAPGPDPLPARVKIPSHSEEPSVPGTTFKLLKTGGPAVLPVPDEVGDAVIEPQGYGLAANHAVGYVENIGEDQWRLYGQIEPVALPVAPDPALHQLLYDIYDFDTLFQDTAGTIPVTTVGQPVCYVANKGTLGSEADLIAPAADRGYTLEISNGGLKLKRASATSCLLSAEELDLNLATLNLFFDLQVFTHLNNGGVLTFQSSTNSDVNQNDGGFIALGGVDGSVSCRFGNPPAAPSITGSIAKLPHVFEFHKPGNAATASLFCDNSHPSQISQSATVTSLTTMARRLIFGARQGNTPATNYITSFADVGFSRMVGGDAVQTTDQRNLGRVFCEGGAYGNLPDYPALATLADVEAARELLIDELTSGAGIPTALATLEADATILSIPTLAGLTGVASVSKMIIPGYALRPRVFFPVVAWNGTIVFSHEGHDAPIGSNGINAQVIQRAMNVGAIVVCFPLPGFIGGNDYTSGDPAEHEAARADLMEWFGPNSIAANTMLDLYPDARLIITGISGGGFTSTLCAAADVRFVVSVQCVGTLPDMCFFNRDFEQRRGQITADYMTLYLLCAANGRLHYLLGHRLDTVGFGDVVFNTRPDFTAVLTAQATSLGGTFIHQRENVAPHAYSVNDGVLLQSLMV